MYRYKPFLEVKTSLDLPHEEFSLLTSDGIVIRGHHTHILPDHKLHPSVIIIAHGGLVAKDCFAEVLLTAWLVKHFDVMSFDFRGHGESGGAWTGDGKTVVDLKAVIDFARQKGYQKVGVFGRSMGGWTAVLEAVDYHDVDAIVLAGMPPGFFTEVPLFYGLIEMLRYPGAPFLLRLVRGIRYKYFENIRSPIKEIGKVAPVPLLILYNEADPGAGVAGVPGYWESIPPKSRELTFRRIRSLPFTAQQIYEAACPPKELQLLPGAAHVYSLMALRSLFDCVELWFQHHLVGDETSEYV